MHEEFKDIIGLIREVAEDDDVPKNVKKRLEEISIMLEDDKTSVSILIDRALQSLDELANETNLQSFVRTQIWNIISSLESI